MFCSRAFWRARGFASVLLALLLLATVQSTASADSGDENLVADTDTSDDLVVDDVIDDVDTNDVGTNAIFGGTPVNASEYKYFSAVFNSETENGCGAILITERHFLTAAHCLENEAGELVDKGSVQAQIYPGTSVGVASVIAHPGYGSEQSSSPDSSTWAQVPINTWDLAIIELDSAVSEITPAVLGDWPYAAEGETPPPLTSDLYLLGAGQSGTTASGLKQAVVQPIPYFAPEQDNSCQWIIGDVVGGQTCMKFHGAANGVACGGDSGGPLVKDEVVRGIFSQTLGLGDFQCGAAVYGIGMDLWNSGSRCWINEQVEKDGEEDSGLKVSWSHSEGLDADLCVQSDRDGMTPTCSTALVDAYKGEKQRRTGAYLQALHEYESSPAYLSWLAEHEAAQVVALAYVYSVDQAPASDDVAQYAAWQLASVEVGEPPPGRPQVNWDTSLSDLISYCQDLLDAWGEANQEDPVAAEAVGIVAGGLQINFEFVEFVASQTTSPMGTVDSIEVWGTNMLGHDVLEGHWNLEWHPDSPTRTETSPFAIKCWKFVPQQKPNGGYYDEPDLPADLKAQWGECPG